jgi:hypothetical protein
MNAWKQRYGRLGRLTRNVEHLKGSKDQNREEREYLDRIVDNALAYGWKVICCDCQEPVNNTM